MNCAEFRERLLIDPHDPAVKTAAEAEVCPDARLQFARALAFEKKLQQALDVEVPPALESRILIGLGQIQGNAGLRSRRGWLALAASISLGAIMGAWLWQADPTDELASACVDHLKHEPYAITRTRDVPQPLVQRLFHESGVTLKGVPVAIQYGQPCRIGRYSSLHMVAQKASGPVTVLYLSNPPELSRYDFRERTMVGRVVPMGSGALVLLAEHNADFDDVEQGFRGAIEGPASAAGTI